ncbi:MAG: septum formation protein Maf, partial [Clostridia bacterium]|nr:septum formation protein Maf [Clostridia bacterium]
MEKFILASASPRRRELLEQIGMKFDILISDADEDGIDKSLPPELYVQELAILKANSAAQSLRNQNEKKGIVISADTVVSCDGKILGKPHNEAEAEEMLSLLSGRVHEVYTGVCVMDISNGFSVAEYEKTTVFFNELSEKKINAYIKTGEPFDKAGGYGIQSK